MTTPPTSPPDGYRPVIATSVHLLVGPLLWAAHFTLIYAGQSIACALASASLSTVLFGLDGVQIGIVALTAGMAGAALVLLLRHKRFAASEQDEVSDFLTASMRLLCVLSALGIVAAGATALALPTCPPLR